MRPTKRLIELLETVNATAVDNDHGKPGEFLAELCRESASRLRELEFHYQERMEQVGEFLAARGYSNGDIPALEDDEIENNGC